tara:strand:- start:12089 stop:14266 length:2178 start_codon:yes stop_codon:yes gene_type:complete
MESKINCSKCNWSWNVKDGGDDLYNCHKCGYDNTSNYVKGGKIKSSKDEDGNWSGTYRGATFKLFHMTNDLSKAKYWSYSYKLYSPIMLREETFFSDSDDDLPPIATKKTTLEELKRSIDNRIEELESFKKNSKADILKKGGQTKSWKNKYNKKYGYSENESHSLKEISKDSGVSKKGLQKIYNKGVGAFKTNPKSVRPNITSKEQWGMGRVYSSVMGGKASKIDSKELKMEYGGIMPQSFLKFDNGGLISEEVTLDTYDFSGYDYREQINQKAGVSFLLTGEYELVSKAIYEKSYSMWLYYNYLNRINIGFDDMVAWKNEAQEYYGDEMPVPVSIVHAPNNKDGRSTALWLATPNKDIINKYDIYNDQSFFYNGMYYVQEISMVANFDGNGNGWGTMFMERKTDLLVPYIKREKSFHLNTIIHEFAHCLDFQTQLLKNIEKLKKRQEQLGELGKEEIGDLVISKDDNGVVIIDNEKPLTDADKKAKRLEYELYGTLMNTNINNVTKPITNHFDEFVTALVKILEDCSKGKIPLTQVYEQEAIDMQIILSGVYGDMLLEQRKKNQERKRLVAKADSVRDNKRFGWNISVNSTIKNFVKANTEDIDISNFLVKSKKGNFTLFQILEFDNMINKFIDTEYKTTMVYQPEKAKKLRDVIKDIKKESNRIINNHYDNIKNNYEFGFKPESKADMYLASNCKILDFDFYKDWKVCSKIKVNDFLLLKEAF